MHVTGNKYTFKISVIGDGRVGKTSLIKKFTKGSFQTDYIKTIGAQFSVFDKMVNGDEIRLFFWDIAGQDDFHFLRSSFFKNSKAAIIVYSLEENELGKMSFAHTNKVDLVNQSNLDTSSVKNFVKEGNYLNFFLTSAKTGQGVVEAFNEIIKILYKKYRLET
ncbi:MAG: GTP-binding protein [Candidatus Lokiarchaeota archaeon]